MPADNWEELEPLARDAVLAQGGTLDEHGRYLCPPELASKTICLRIIPPSELPEFQKKSEE